MAKNISWSWVLVLVLAGCQTTPKPVRMLSLDGVTSEIPWSKEERQKEFVIRTWRTTPEASFHLIRLKTLEKPHTHEKHDLVVVLLSGRAQVSLEGQMLEMNPGDILEIPRGKVHWAENLAAGASEAYAIFTPPFDGKDSHYLS